MDSRQFGGDHVFFVIRELTALAAIIRSDGPSRADLTFRYAPLSSGLDIVRKTLGQHEIATVQTTSVDQTAGNDRAGARCGGRY